jgi:hypothetical protein
MAFLPVSLQTGWAELQKAVPYTSGLTRCRNNTISTGIAGLGRAYHKLYFHTLT